MASIIRKLFQRKKQPPLVCAVSIDAETGEPVGAHPDHHHTSACFIDLEPLAVVEVFQSQGCQACGPALPGIHEATTHPNLLLLSYPVTLFDHLGWKDTLASSANDARHRAYAKAWSRTSIFTPQVVVDGLVDGSGAGGKDDVQELIARGRAARKSFDYHVIVDANDSEAHIDTDKEEAPVHDILFVTYAAADSVVKPAKGPNKGKKMNHRHVVQSVSKIGEWKGGNLTVPLPSPKSSLPAGVEAAVLVQAPNAGAIVASTRV